MRTIMRRRTSTFAVCTRISRSTLRPCRSCADTTARSISQRPSPGPQHTKQRSEPSGGNTMSEIETVQIGEDMPRIGTVAPDPSWADARCVVVSWVSGPRQGKAEIVDLAPDIFAYKLYQPLRADRDLFNTVHVIDGGAALAWGTDDAIDMAATTVERLAEEV